MDKRRKRELARRPLVVTSDPDLLDELLRLAAATGLEVDVAADPAAAHGHYTTAPLVLVGADQMRACLQARLPRRTNVMIAIPPGGNRSGPDGNGAAPGGSGADLVAGETGDDPCDLAQPLGAAHVASLPAAQPWLVDRFAGWRRDHW